MTTERFEYYAFISYSRQDEKWAAWLHKRLETYRLPSALRKETGSTLPKQVRPVFRDRTDIGLGGLERSLHRELQDSRYLIVVCSPRSAQSEWVNREVQHFQAMGRGDRVIPFIVEGAPDAEAPDRQCYPPALRNTSDVLLGASLEELAPEEALVKIVAAILGIKFDQLWNRHKRRERKRRLIQAAVAMVCLAAMALSGWLAWDYYVPKHAYYADYVERELIPEGLFPLSREQLARRNAHYHFVRQYRRLQRVIHENSAGTPVRHRDSERLDRPMIQRFNYDDGGALIGRDYLDLNDRVLVRQKIERPMTRKPGEEAYCYLDFRDEQCGSVVLESATTSMRFGAFGLNDAGSRTGGTKSSIGRHRLVFAETGFVKEARYMGVGSLTPVPDGDGLFGLRYTRDELGRIVQTVYLDPEGKPTATKTGLAGVRYRYDGAGNLSRCEWLSLQGTPWPNEQGVAVSEMDFDSVGNTNREKYLDADGAPCLSEDGYAGWADEYDARGNVTREAYFGVDGAPCLSKDGYAEARLEYDGRGNRTRVAYFGVDGEPCLSKDGYAEWTAEYDERGNRTRVAYFGVDSEPCLHRDGNAGWTTEYDERGNLIRQAYFGMDGEPCLHRDGNAGWTTEYDARGNVTREAYFGVDGEPCLSKDGYAEWTTEYDARGNVVRAAYFGANGEPCLDRDGVAGWTAEYDARGNRTREAYFGVDGEPCLSRDGYAEARFEHDARGNQTRQAYFGVDGEPCLDRDGIAGWTYEYDARGNPIRRTYCGVDGEPCLNRHGYARVTYAYDTTGTRTQEKYWDLLGNEVPDVIPALTVTDVYAGTPAMEAGIAQGDVLLAWQGWDWSMVQHDPGFDLCYKAIGDTANKEKVVVIWDGEEVRTHQFPAGIIGMRIEPSTLPAEQASMILTAFQAWSAEHDSQETGNTATPGAAE